MMSLKNILSKQTHAALKIISGAVLTAFVLVALTAISVNAQVKVVDTTDIMKEFDENSFRDASPVRKVKDSSRLFQHLIGVKAGYSLNDVSFSQAIDHKALTSAKNFGIYYIYYHSLWNSIPLFGIETGLQYTEKGYKSMKYTEPDTVKNRKATTGKERYQCIEIPFVSQFRVDFWKMRILANVGAFGSYTTSTSFTSVVPDSISTTYRKFGYGLIVGGGIALIFKPVEVHFEVNYKYSLNNLFDQKAFYTDTWVSTHPTQLVFTVGLFYRIGKPYGSRNSYGKKTKRAPSIELAPAKK